MALIKENKALAIMSCICDPGRRNGGPLPEDRIARRGGHDREGGNSPAQTARDLKRFQMAHCIEQQEG
jgi:hypothetical protein